MMLILHGFDIWDTIHIYYFIDEVLMHEYFDEYDNSWTTEVSSLFSFDEAIKLWAPEADVIFRED